MQVNLCEYFARYNFYKSAEAIAASQVSSAAPENAEIVEKGGHGHIGIDLKSLSPALREKLEKMDTNNDGNVDEDELVAAIEELIRNKQLNALFKKLIASLVLIMVVLVGVLTYMTYAVVDKFKDTSVDTSGNQPMFTDRVRVNFILEFYVLFDLLGFTSILVLR